MTKLKCTDYGGKKRHTGDPCNRPAGWGTDHPGTGKCKLHGGSATGGPIKTGKYSVRHKERLQSKIQEFMDSANPLDLSYELALARSLLDNYKLRKHDESDEFTLQTLQQMFTMITDISKAAERFSRIINQTALTVAEVNYLQARLADLIVKYLPDEGRRNAFWDEFRSAITLHRPGSRTLEDSRASSEPGELAVPF